MDLTYATQGGEGLQIIDHLLAGGEMVAAQLPTASMWSPERKLAASVLVNALIEVRDHATSEPSRQRKADALRWIYSDNRTWPFSFLRLCEQFSLNPGWVRRIVRGWQEAMPRKKLATRFRHAA